MRIQHGRLKGGERERGRRQLAQLGLSEGLQEGVEVLLGIREDGEEMGRLVDFVGEDAVQFESTLNTTHKMKMEKEGGEQKGAKRKA